MLGSNRTSNTSPNSKRGICPPTASSSINTWLQTSRRTLSFGVVFSLVVESLASNMSKSTEWDMRSFTAILASLGSHKKKLSPLSSRELPAQLHFIPPQKNSYPKNVANLLPKRCWFSFPELVFSDSPASHVRFQRYGSDPVLVDFTPSNWKFGGCHLRCHLQIGRVSTWHPQYCEWLDERSLVSWLAPRSLVKIDWLLRWFFQLNFSAIGFLFGPKQKKCMQIHIGP